MPTYNESFGHVFGNDATDTTPTDFGIRFYECEGIDLVGVTTPTKVKEDPGVWEIYATESRVVTVVLLDPDYAPADGVTEPLTTLQGRLWDGEADGIGDLVTDTIYFTGEASPPASVYEPAGLVEWFDPDQNTGSIGTEWVGAIEGKVATAVGTPTLVAPPGGTATNLVAIGSGAGFTSTDFDSMPLAAADRTVMLAAKLTGGFGYAGFGWGANVAGQAFTLSIDNGFQLALDIAGSRTLLGVVPATNFFIMTARYSGGTLDVFVGAVKVFSGAMTLNTGSTRINFCRTFSNNTTIGQLGDILVYGRALSDTEVLANVAVANGRFVGDTTATNPGAPTASGITAGGFTASATLGEAYGYYAWAVKAGTGSMTEAEILAGTGALTYGVSAANNSTAWTTPVTGATASTDYKVHGIFYDLAGGKSAVIASSTITTSGAGAPAPSLSAADGNATGTTTADLSATTDTANGDAILGAILDGATTPNRTQLRAGTDGDDAAIRTVVVNPVSSTSLAGSVAGLAPDTTYRTVAQQDGADAQQSSVIVSAGTWTTPAVPATARETVEGLFNGATPVGRTSTNTPLGVGDVPAGVSVGSNGNHTLLTITQDDVVMEDFVLTDVRINVNGRTGFQFLQSSLLQSTAPSGGANYMLNIPPGSNNALIEYVTMAGYADGPGNDDKLLAHLPSGTTVSATCATGVILRGIDLGGYSNDGMHLAGGGLLAEYCLIRPPANAGSDITIYSGTPGDYTTGDYVRFQSGAQSIWYCARCLSATPTTDPVQGSVTADWGAGGSILPHSDMINPRASIGAGMTLRYIYFHDGYLFLPSGLRAIQQTNCLRLVRNSGNSQQFQNVSLQYLMNDRNGEHASTPYSAAPGSGANYTGPIDVADCWMGSKDGIPGYWNGGGAFMGTWSNVVDVHTGVAIPAP